MTKKKFIFLIIVFLAIQAGVLYWFGQPAICRCGYIKIWEGLVLSSGNSQHLTDWYTFSHIIHGFLFYLLLWLVFPKMPVSKRLLIAMGIEIGWEILENTPMVINHYRQQALAQGYTGDSIINSVVDTLAMMAGFFMARKWPVWSIVAIGLGMELFVGMMIRDNLTLNVLNLIHIFPAVSRWQAGG
ncbi:MAG TPA: DUF2585 domain-containing protein [Negativicutes bacterium]|nr:DUF2585 domain-containing protein [Negativicutes bacterium]